MQKVLTAYSQTASLREGLDGWSAEDADEVAKAVQRNTWKPELFAIGLARQYQGFYCYRTALEALAAGWKLLAPPQPIVDEHFKFIWWFVKD